MVQYIQQKNIDRIKYDACIQQAKNSRIFAYSWYLDIVADNWDVLVLMLLLNETFLRQYTTFDRYFYRLNCDV